MQAYQLTAWQHDPELREVPVPEVGPGQVLLRVGGAGVCHSDLHLMQWPPGQLDFPLPFTLGHENAGWVAEVGAGVQGLEIGAPVAVYGPWGCGRCKTCRTGAENYCEHQADIGTFGGGLGRDGGMAPYMLVPDPRLLIELGDLDPRDAAPLGDAALTPYHAIKRSLPLLTPGSTAVVIGCGGLGHMAIQLLSALTPARIVGVDVDERHRELARAVGADEVVDTPEAASAISTLTCGMGAALVLDIVGSDQTLALAAKCVRVRGHLTVLGLAGGYIPWTEMGVLPWEVELTTTYWGTAIELMEVLDLARSGHIEVNVTHFDFDRVQDAYDALREGKIEGRAVVCPNG